MLSPEVPLLNLVYEEEGLQFFIANVQGEMSLHTVNTLPVTKERYKHLQDRLDCLVFTLMEKGLDHVDTWIPPENKKDIRFAEAFGFVCTGWDKVVTFETDKGYFDKRFVELRLEFPKD